MHPIRSTILLLSAPALTFVLHCFIQQHYPFHADELYFIACAKRLAWGYVDHPPLVPFLTRIAGEIAGYTPRVVRFFPLLSVALTAGLTGLLARRLGGGLFAQSAAIAAFVLAPVYLRATAILSIPSVELTFWIVLAHLYLTILRGGNPRWWMAIGLVCGLGLLNKHTTLFFGLGLFMGLLLTRHRANFRSPWLYMGGVLAFLLFTPNLWWQHTHDKATLEFLRHLNQQDMAPRTVFVLAQLGILNPIAAPLWLGGLWWLLFGPQRGVLRPLGLVYVAFFLALVVLSSKVYYLAVVYPMLLAAGGVWLEQHWRRRRAVFYAAALVATNLILLPAAMPLWELPKVDAYVSRVTGGLIGPSNVTVDLHMQHGFQNQAETVARVLEKVRATEGRDASVLVRNYGQAGAMEYYGEPLGLPRPICGHMNYWLWGPGEAQHDVVVAYGFHREDLEEWFAEVVQVDTIHHPLAANSENNLAVYLCRQVKGSLQERWPEFKRYDHSRLPKR